MDGEYSAISAKSRKSEYNPMLLHWRTSPGKAVGSVGKTFSNRSAIRQRLADLRSAENSSTASVDASGPALV